MTDGSPACWSAAEAFCCTAGSSDEEPAVADLKALGIAVEVEGLLCPEHKPMAISAKATADIRWFMTQSNPGNEIAASRLFPALVPSLGFSSI
jgi:hypothetical protein